MARNIYVLDTCVLVHDPNAIFKFAEHDVYIPLTVIDELDKFKDEQGRRGWSAREFFRIYDALETDAMHDPKKGAKLGDKGGKLFVFNTELRLKRQMDAGSLTSKLADNVIIRSAQQIKEDYNSRKVVLVTKDRGLLIRARGWEVMSENYRSDLVQETLYTGTREVAIETNADWDVLWNSGEEVMISKLSEAVKVKLSSVHPNEVVIFAWGDAKFPTLHKANGQYLTLANLKMDFLGIKPKNLEQRCAMALLADTSIPFIALNGAAGTGKAQPLHAPILTATGFKPMGEIGVGESVYSADGKLTLVTGVFPQGEKDIYRVRFSDGAVAECCDEHLWTVQNEYDRDKGRVRTIELREIMGGLRGHDGRRNYSVPLVRVEFREAELPLDPYLLGVLLGDGGLRQATPVLSSVDTEIITSVADLLPKGVSVVKVEGGTCDYRLSGGQRGGSSNALTDALRSLGLMALFSHEKFIPEAYLTASVAQRLALLQGLMDTDGTCDKRGTHVSFATSSDRLASDLVAVVRSLGGVAKVTRKSRSYSREGVRVPCMDSLNITVNLPADLAPFRLSRKTALYIPKTKYAPKRYIESVEFVEKMQAQCIRVAHPSHLYVTSDYVLTHNTMSALAVTLQQIAEEKYERMIFIKPVVPVGGKDIGFLPGSKTDKLLAWLGPLSDNIDQIVGRTSQDGRRPVEAMMEDGKIDAEAMTYIQGRSIANAVIIVDESQNIKPREARMVVERCGPGSRVIFLGDLSQIEDPYLDRRSCGLAHAIEGGKTHPLSASITLTKVERSPLAAAASEIFSRPEAQR